MPIADPEKRRAYFREYTTRRYRDEAEFKVKHKARVSRNDTKRRDALRLLTAEFKKDGCVFCSETASCCLSAHHLRSKSLASPTL